MKLKKIAFSLFFLTSFSAQLCIPLYHSLVEEFGAEVCGDLVEKDREPCKDA